MKRIGVMLTTHCAIFAIVIPAFVQPSPRLIWNASASVPTGLYVARPFASVRRGQLVSANPPAALARLMAARGYLPLGVPMLKHVAAVTRQRICRIGALVSIDGVPIAAARQRDRRGRRLPSWQGCRVLGKGEILLLNPASPDSFDGRYFGPVPTRSVTAVLTPVWTRDDGEAGTKALSSPTTNGVSK